MAGEDVIGTAVLNLKANTGGFLGDIEKAAKGAEKLMSGMSGSMSGAMKGAGGIMSAGITAPIVGIGLFAVASAEKVDGAMAQMAKATGAQGAQLTMLQNSWKSVYSSVPTDAATVTAVVTQLSQSLHLQGQALTDAATGAIQYAKNTNTSADADVKSITTMTQATQGKYTAIQVTDMLTVAYQQTGQKVEAMAPAFDKTTAAMTKMGMGVPAQIALISQLGAEGLPVRQVTTLLNGLGPVAEKAGVSSMQFWQHMVADAKTGHYTTDELKLLGKNTENFSAAAKSGKLDNDALAKSIANSGGATKTAEENNRTFAESFSLFKQKAEVALEPLGKIIIKIATDILTALGPVIDFISKILEGFSTLPEPIQIVVVAIAGIAAAIGPVLMIVGMMLPALTALTPIVTGLGMAFGVAGVTADTALLPAVIAIATALLPIIIIVGAIGIALYLLYTYFKPFHDAVNQVVGWVKTLVGDLMSGNFGKLGDDFKKGIMAAIDALKKVDWGGIAKQFLAALLGIPPQFMSTLQKLDWGGFAQSIITFLTTDVPQFLNAVKNLDWGGFARAVIMDLIGVDILFWQSIMNLDWGGFANTVINDIVSLVGNVYSAFTGLDWGGLANTIINDITNLAGNLLSAFENLDWGSLGNAIAGAIGNALHSVSFDTHIPGIGVVTLAEGGIVSGGHLAVIGEAGPEMVVPQKYWNMVNPSLFSMLPHYQGGGVVGGSSPMFGGAFGSSTYADVNKTANLIGQQFESKWKPTHNTLAGVWQTLMMGLTNWKDALKAGDYKTATDAHKQMLSDISGFVQQQYGNGTTTNTILTQISSSLTAQEAAMKAAGTSSGSTGTIGNSALGGAFKAAGTGPLGTYYTSTSGIELDDPNINPGPGYVWNAGAGVWDSTSAANNAAFMQHAASGGIAVKPTFGVFGEAGPEALIPLTSSALSKAGLGGNGDITFQPGAIQINNPQFTNAAEAQRITDQISRQLAFKTSEYVRRAGHSRG